MGSCLSFCSLCMDVDVFRWGRQHERRLTEAGDAHDGRLPQAEQQGGKIYGWRWAEPMEWARGKGISLGGKVAGKPPVDAAREEGTERGTYGGLASWE